MKTNAYTGQFIGANLIVLIQTIILNITIRYLITGKQMTDKETIKESIRLVKISASACHNSGFAHKKPTKRMVLMKNLLNMIYEKHKNSFEDPCLLDQHGDCIICTMDI
jgi:hypothetical protein